MVSGRQRRCLFHEPFSRGIVEAISGMTVCCVHRLVDSCKKETGGMISAHTFPGGNERRRPMQILDYLYVS